MSGLEVADLRRQVEAVRARYRDAGPAGTPTQAGYDAGADDALADVLALIDGADQ